MHALDRRRLLTSGAAAAVMAASGLGAQAAPSQGGTLRIGVAGASKTDRFDGLERFGTFMRIAGQGCAFDCLTEISADGMLVGELAESWEGSAGSQRWMFLLRDDVCFHDGRRFGPDDVIATFRRHLKAGAGSPVHGLLSDVREVRRAGPRQVVFELTAPRPDFPFLLSDPQLIVHPAAGAAAPSGTGLYRVTAFDPGRYLRAERVRAHWKAAQAGWFDSVEIHAFASRRARLAALVHGDVDVIDDPGAGSVETLGRMPRLATASVRGNAQLIIQPTRRMSGVSHTDVREALAFGVPRDALARTLLAGYGRASSDTPLGPDNRYAVSMVPEFDPVRAKTVLRCAGLNDVTLGLPVLEDAAQSDLREAFAGTGIVPGFGAAGDLALMQVSGRATEDWAFSTPPPQGGHWLAGTGADRQRFDALLAHAREATQSAERAAAYAQLEDLVARNGSQAVPLAADFLIAHSARLAHGPSLGRVWALDSARIAERWWFA